ncbi:MFS transporter [Dyadobacter psychrotolerans]|uniref:MFS transporter n=1 Tax=Dyadobacter psychrotolerans TaxID=2541721 RepID=A0A4R5DVZ4_9BACT|nr:MFS transporter [Dyadobacter psychrotolerans]TDE15415.1 MFS transporter [Dyadobacter psychrotolerans]
MIRSILRIYRISFTGLSRETWLLSVVILINRCGYMAIPFMSMYITQSLHRSIADAGLIITLFGVGSVLGAMAGGYLTDKIGFHPVQVVSLIISGLLFVLFGHVDNFNGLCFLTVVLSFFVEAFKPANNSAIATYSSRENMTRSYALNRLATNIGFGFGTSVGGILAAINYHLLFWVDGVVYVVAGIMIILLLPSGKNLKNNVIENAEFASGKSPWKDPFFVRFIILVTLYMFSFILIFRIVPVYWKQELGIGEATIGLLLGMNGVIIALFEMVMIQKLGSRKPDHYYIIAGVLFTAASFLCLVIPAIAPVVIGAFTVFLFTIGEMLTLPYMNTLVVSRSTESNRGKYSAAYSLSWAVAQVIGPASGGYVAENFGYNALWIVLVVLSVFCAFGFKFLFQNKMASG